MLSPFEERLVQRIPMFARRLLDIEPPSHHLADTLRHRDIEVQVVSSCKPDSPVAGPFDCIVLNAAPLTHEAGIQLFGAVAPLVASNGYVLVRLPSTMETPQTHAFTAAVAEAGLRTYDSWPYGRHDGGEEGLVCVLARQEYDPVRHAKACRIDGHPEWGHQILSTFLDFQATPEENRALAAAEKQACVLAMDRPGDQRRRLLLFNAALMHFYQVTEILPTLQSVYICQAEFWRRIGDHAMAARLLRTIQRLAPNETVSHQLADLASSPQEPSTQFDEPLPPLWTACRTTPRILLITAPQPHYGLDALYDGLCEVLGDENVIDFPWKPLLHGQRAENEYYPCSLDRRGERRSLEEIEILLRDKYFDIVLFGALDQEVDREVVRRIVAASGSVPWYLVDQQDECADFFDDALALLDGALVCGCFKREMLQCVDYGPRVIPLPFSYPDSRAATNISEQRPETFFWAGQRWCGLRDIYLRHIENVLGETFEQKYDQEGYAAAMRRARIGLNGFGGGFDTVRYWELPAQGCMLLSERPPIRIPHNFEDGISAVFFDDLNDLDEKLKYYLANPDVVSEIALAGHEHFMRYHTSSARARQMLGWINHLSKGG